MWFKPRKRRQEQPAPAAPETAAVDAYLEWLSSEYAKQSRQYELARRALPEMETNNA